MMHLSDIKHRDVSVWFAVRYSFDIPHIYLFRVYGRLSEIIISKTYRFEDGAKPARTNDNTVSIAEPPAKTQRCMLSLTVMGRAEYNI